MLVNWWRTVQGWIWQSRAKLKSQRDQRRRCAWRKPLRHLLHLEQLEDRTAPATFLVRDIRPAAGLPSAPEYLTNVNGTLFFVANDGNSGFELWKSDGTSTGTQLVRDINPGALSSNPRWLTNVNGTLFFVATDGSSGYELWRSNGAATSTQRVADLVPGVGSPFVTGSGFSWSFVHPSLTEVNGTLYFVANAGGHGFELWRTNGTAAGTIPVSDINPGAGDAFSTNIHPSLTNVNGTLFFIANDGPGGIGSELWKLEPGAPAVQLVRDIRTGAGSAFGSSQRPLLANVSGTLFFVANNGASGYELWRSQGHAANTVLVRDIRSGPASSFPTVLFFPFSSNLDFRWANVSGTLYFVANNGNDGYELWRSDGSSAGTQMVRDIFPGGFFTVNSSNPNWLTNVNGTLFFAATNSAGTELWKSDGTASGTVLVRNINPSGSSYPSYLTNVSGLLFFAADDGVNGIELWRSDGSSTGTFLVANIRLAGGNASPKYLTNVSGRLFFQANDGTHGAELWAHIEPANIIQVEPPADGLYRAGDALNFTVRYNREVFVNLTNGRPRLVLNIGGNTRYALYTTGSGTTALTFQYVIAPGELDTDGIQMTPEIDLNGGMIRDAVQQPAQTVFSPPNLSGVLVDALMPYIVQIQAPAPGTYTTGQRLEFQVQWSEAVNVDTSSGTPQLRLGLANGDRYAIYDSGSGTDTLVFQYTVQAGDYDFDGIVLHSPLELNGGTITSAADSDPAFLQFSPPDTSGVLIDALTQPVIVTVSPPAPGTYLTGMNLDIYVRFSRVVYVTTTATGVPDLPIVIGSVTRYATYQSGHGTNLLLFRYVVQADDADLDGITLISPIRLNGGTIRDAANNNANLNFTAPDTSGVLVNPGPRIVQVLAPADGIYLPGQNLDFQVRFDRTVEAITTYGRPRIPLIVGTLTRYAEFHQRSAPDTLTFRYRVVAEDLDTDGIEVLAPIQLQGGTIRDTSNRDAMLNFVPPDTQNVKVNLPSPSATQVDAPAVGLYRLGQVMDFAVRFDQAVSVTLTGGRPRLVLNVGGQTRYAPYFSGSGSHTLTFRYQVQAGDLELIGVGISPVIDLHGGSIRNVVGKPATLGFVPPSTVGVLVDGVVPTILNVTPPAPGTYLPGQSLEFLVQFSEPVYVGTAGQMPALSLVIGAATRLASYVSGSGTDLLTFRYVVQPSDLDTDGITVFSPVALGAASIRDQAQNDAQLSFSAPDTSLVYVGVPPAVVPTILGIEVPPAGTYRAGQQLAFVVRFSEPVQVSGIPSLVLTIGSQTRHATYVGGHGTDRLRFVTTVQVDDFDGNGITLSTPIELNGGTIQNLSSVSADLHFTPPDLTQVMVDGVAPSIVRVSGPAPGLYRAGQALTISVRFSEAVRVDFSGAARPYLRLRIGNAIRHAVFAGQSAADTLLFHYVIQAGERDTNGVEILSPILRPSLSSIRDLAGNHASPSFAPIALPSIQIDAVAPRVVQIVLPAPGAYFTGQALDFLVRFDEPVTVGTSPLQRPALRLRIGSVVRQATFVNQVNATTLRFRYIIQASDLDSDGLEILSPLLRPAGTSIRDTAGNDAILHFVPPRSANIRINPIPVFPFPFV
ncbi:MAG: hypothetical protein NZM42_04325 [Gemmatales bacterium]|nr:hypothetical protein [Gemmatales bacterium]